MLYDLSSDIQARRLRMRVDGLIAKKTVVELTEKRQRTLAQNAYLSVIIGFFATQHGCSFDFAKMAFYKNLVNKDLYLREIDDKLLGHVRYLRNSTELTKEEMSLSIDRFLDWSANVAGIILPEPEDYQGLVAAKQEIEQNKRFL